MPKVSIVIPCFNLGQFVGEAIDSVLDQTCQDFEIIVVNDGSTDLETNRLLGELRCRNTTVYHTDNRGLPAARNYGIGRAIGRYICALDADDKLHPRFLEKTLEVLDRDTSISFVSTWVEAFGTEHWIWRQERCGFPELLAECVVLTASPVRREAIDAVGGYDCEHYLHGCEDWDLWISLVEKGFCGTIIPEVLFYYRQRAASMRKFSEQPGVRARIWKSLLVKHRESYERYLPEVLLQQEIECGEILRANWELQYEIEKSLKPLAAERLAERERLRGLHELSRAEATSNAFADLQRSHDEITRHLAAAQDEVAALRSSASWRITAPLRYGYEGWLAARKLLTRQGLK